MRDPSVNQFGTDDAGFRVMYDRDENTLHVEGWGYWNSGVGAALRRETTAACRQLSPPLAIVMDLTRLKPQGTEGQEALRTLMSSLGAMGGFSGKIHTENVLTRMQLTRLARECGVEASFVFAESDAGLRKAGNG